MKFLLIVEDDLRLREALVAEGEASAHGWTILQADSVAVGRAILRRQRVNALIVDLGLPDGDGRELISECRALSPDSEILVITVFADADRVIGALEAGATGYVLKTDLRHYSGRLVSVVESGGSLLSPSVARGLIDRFRTQRSSMSTAVEAPRLTPREAEILRICEQGFRYAEVASLMNITTHTVNAHLKAIYRKLSVNSRAEAVFEARRTGLIRD